MLYVQARKIYKVKDKYEWIIINEKNSKNKNVFASDGYTGK